MKDDNTKLSRRNFLMAVGASGAAGAAALAATATKTVPGAAQAVETARRGGTVSVWHPEAERLTRQLIEREVICDYRPAAGVRLSPHFFNTEEECDRAIDWLGELAAAR